MARGQVLNPTIALAGEYSPKTADAVRGTDIDIARRAYDLYKARGGEHGHDVEDWLQAERELIGVAAASAAA
jgi:hypothetical protein